MRRLAKFFPMLVVTGATVGLLWSPAASAIDFTADACRRASNSAACSRSSKYELTGNNGIIARVTNLIALIGAVAAVIMIIIGGFFLITAAGDSGKVTTGKRILTYAVIGLIVIALARTIVVFVVSKL